MTRQQRLVALCGLSGGALIAAGSLQPWFSLFAGLQPYPGTVGVYGRILLGIGLLSCTLSVLAWWRPSFLRVTRVAAVQGAIGAATLAFGLWIANGLQRQMVELKANPMLVAEAGPGVPILLLGAVVLTASGLLARPSALSGIFRSLRTTRGRGRRSGHPDRPSLLPSRAR